HVVRTGYARRVSARRRLRGPNPQRRQAGRPSRRAAHQVSVGHQHENCEEAGPDGSADAAAAGGSDHRVAHAGPGGDPAGAPARDLARLTREIADAQQWFGVQAATPVRSCYEAGRDGFWLHRYLTSSGIANVVVDSSSIEVNRRLRRAKSDALDARKLLGMLL